MSRTPVPFAPETLESIRRAFRLAADRRHDLVGLEHLLYALIEDPQARHLLTTCSVDLPQLSRDLDEVLGKAFSPVPGKKTVKPESTIGFDRVVERAVVHAASSSAQQVISATLGQDRFALGRTWHTLIVLPEVGGLQSSEQRVL